MKSAIGSRTLEIALCIEACSQEHIETHESKPEQNYYSGLYWPKMLPIFKLLHNVLMQRAVVIPQSSVCVLEYECYFYLYNILFDVLFKQIYGYLYKFSFLKSFKFSISLFGLFIIY